MTLVHIADQQIRITAKITAIDMDDTCRRLDQREVVRADA
jgi:hypothetical protein